MGQPMSTSISDSHQWQHEETLCESGEAVGRLPEPQRHRGDIDGDGSDNGSDKVEPFVFLSHTGRDKAKEELARPTYFFLKEILKVKAFPDDGEMSWGSTTDKGLATPAYQCTHALVIISPSFRQRRYCVMELNTFLHRFRQTQAEQEQQSLPFKLLPALWKVTNLKGYPDDLQQISRAAHDTDNAVYYMLQTLWPRLIEALGLPQRSERELKQHFITYMDHQLGDPHLAPKDFFKYAKDHGCHLFFPSKETPDCSSLSSSTPGRRLSSSAETSSSSLSSSSSNEDDSRKKGHGSQIIVGICFFNVDMDDSLSWNKKVLKRKASIEEKLAIIASYGEVIYGRPKMSHERTDSVGVAVVRLECEIKLEGDLNDNDLFLVKRADVAIGKLLKGAGTTEEDLNNIMIGTFWRGSLVLLLEAPDRLLEYLFEAVVKQGENILNDGDNHTFKVIGLAPAFTIRAQMANDSQFSSFASSGLEKYSNVVLWKDETAVADLNLLFPTSLEARGKLLACGLPCAESCLESCNSIATTLLFDRLPSLLQKQGRLREVDLLLREVLEKKQKFLGHDHKSTLMSLNNLAWFLQEQGKFYEAGPLLWEALVKRQNVLGCYHPSTLVSLNNMASLLQAQGKLEKAERMFREAVQKQFKVLGRNHPQTLTCLSNLGSLLRTQGKMTEAEQLFRQALQKQQTTLGHEHPDTIISLNNLASLLRAEGKMEEAEQLFRDALEMRQNTLGVEHPDTLISLNNLASLLRAQGQLNEAELLFQEALDKKEKMLGPNHPGTLITLNNLALLLRDKGELEEAEPLFREALDRQRLVLGSNHPHTFASLMHLALLLKDQQKFSEAEHLLQEVLKKQESMMGGDPDTLTSSMLKKAELLFEGASDG